MDALQTAGAKVKRVWSSWTLRVLSHPRARVQALDYDCCQLAAGSGVAGHAQIQLHEWPERGNGNDFVDCADQ